MSKYENIDYCNAKLYYDGIDYYIILTCYIDKDNTEKQYNNDIVCIDMGVSTSLTLSDGTKYNISIEESEKLKRLQAKLSRQKKAQTIDISLLRKSEKSTYI